MAVRGAGARRFSPRGITLVELMINVAIISFIGGVTTMLFIEGYRNWKLSRVKVEIQRDARNSLDLMNKYIRQGKAGSVVISRKDANQPPYSQMTFTTTDGAAVNFYQSGRILYEIFNGQQIIITRQLRALQFAYPDTSDPNIVQISVTFEGQTYEGGSKALQLSVEKVRVMND